MAQPSCSPPAITLSALDSIDADDADKARNRHPDQLHPRLVAASTQ
jgi:hypothetical protein